MIAVLATMMFFNGSCMQELPIKPPSNIVCQLSDNERERTVNRIKFALKKMYIALDKAEKEANKIGNIKAKDTIIAAIEGAIAGLAAGGPYESVIGACASVIAKIGSASYDHLRECYSYVIEAHTYALYADEQQERLWRDE